MDGDARALRGANSAVRFAHLARWVELAKAPDPYEAPTAGTIRARFATPAEEKPGAEPTYVRYRFSNRLPADPNTPVVRYDEYTLVKTAGMSFRTAAGRAEIYAKVIRRVEREAYREAHFADPHYSIDEEEQLDDSAFVTAAKLSAKYTPPKDETA
jgi:hypothetical protein